MSIRMLARLPFSVQLLTEMGVCDKMDTQMIEITPFVGEKGEDLL